MCGFQLLVPPAGRNPEGLPLAIRLAAPRQAEARLLAAGAWCERVLDITSW